VERRRGPIPIVAPCKREGRAARPYLFGKGGLHRHGGLTLIISVGQLYGIKSLWEHGGTILRANGDRLLGQESNQSRATRLAWNETADGNLVQAETAAEQRMVDACTPRDHLEVASEGLFVGPGAKSEARPKRRHYRPPRQGTRNCSW
jgi:hypothetical protein